MRAAPSASSRRTRAANASRVWATRHVSPEGWVATVQPVFGHVNADEALLRGCHMSSLRPCLVDAGSLRARQLSGLLGMAGGATTLRVGLLTWGDSVCPTFFPNIQGRTGATAMPCPSGFLPPQESRGVCARTRIDGDAPRRRPCPGFRFRGNDESGALRPYGVLRGLPARRPFAPFESLRTGFDFPQGERTLWPAPVGCWLRGNDAWGREGPSTGSG